MKKKLLIFVILLMCSSNVMASGLTLNKQKITLNIKEQFNVYDINYYNSNEKYTYQSSNTDVVIVNGSGLVVAKKNGDATITIKDSKNNSSKLSVHVTPITDYITNNSKKAVPCGIDSNLIKEYNSLLDQVTNNHNGTRASVVAAIRYLALQFPYTIPYYWRDNMMTLPKRGHYAYEGLNLNNTDGWGCQIKKTARAIEEYNFYVGKKYPNGLECSGLITWALTNGGFSSIGDWNSYMFKASHYQDRGYWNTFNDGGKYYSDRYTEAEINKVFNTFNRLSPINKHCINFSCGATESSNKKLKIKSGDLIWREGHIGMIISVERDSNGQNKKIYIAESILRGLTVNSFTPKELSNDTRNKKFTHLVNMDEIYINNEVNDIIKSNTNQVDFYAENKKIISKVVSNNNTYGKLPIIKKKDSLNLGWFTSNGIKIKEDTKIILTDSINLSAKFLVCGDKYDNNIMCDVNGDKIFNYGDAGILLKYLVGISSISNIKYADANGDGVINTGDVVTMIRKYYIINS